MNLESYTNEENAKIKIMNYAKSVIIASDSSESILLAVKSVESLENVNHLPIFDEVIVEIHKKINNMDMNNMTGEDLTLLSRAMKLKDIPIGSEDRWAQLTQDEKNVDFHGDVVVGERTLESFDDKILEDFYTN